MKFNELQVTKGKTLKDGDFFALGGSHYLVIRPLVGSLNSGFINKGYSYINLTFASGVSSDLVFDTLKELEEHLEKEGKMFSEKLVIYDGESTTINLGEVK